jgi:hypothetical protein
MDDAKVIADRLRSAEMELQFAQRAFDGSDQARLRYARALHELELVQRIAMKHCRGEEAA